MLVDDGGRVPHLGGDASEVRRDGETIAAEGVPEGVAFPLDLGADGEPRPTVDEGLADAQWALLEPLLPKPNRT